MAAPKKPPRRNPRRSGRRPVRPGTKAPRAEKVQVSLMSTIFNRTVWVAGAAVLAGIIIVFGLLLWFNRVYADPENVYWGMIDNNLATLGVTKEVRQQAEGGSSVENSQLSWNPSPRVRSVQALTYKSPNEPAELTIESIMTPTDQFQHYARIERPNDGRKDYSNVYDLWLKNGGTGVKSDPQPFNNAIYGALLFGNFSRPERAEIKKGLKEAYRVDMTRVEKKQENDRRVYTYDVILNLQKYATAARSYARFMGLPSANLINPANYRPSDNIAFKVTVDVLSRQVEKVEYQGANTETYSGYGLPADTKLPARTVSSNELRKAIEGLTK